MFEIFKESDKLIDVADGKMGFSTSDNKKFLRFWYEVCNSKIKFNIASDEESENFNMTWVPYNKGGSFCKWYGNQEYLVKWKNAGFELKSSKKPVLRNLPFQFKRSISWSKISSGNIAFRYYPKGFIFDVAGCSLFPYKNYCYVFGFLNSKISQYMLNFLSPTLNYEIGHIISLPIIFDKQFNIQIGIYVRYNLKINKYLVFCEFDLANINFSFYEIVKHINMCLRLSKMELV